MIHVSKLQFTTATHRAYHSARYAMFKAGIERPPEQTRSSPVLSDKHEVTKEKEKGTKLDGMLDAFKKVVKKSSSATHATPAQQQIEADPERQYIVFDQPYQTLTWQERYYVRRSSPPSAL